MSSNASNFSGTLEVPQRDPLFVIIPVSIIYAVIFATGVIGNVCTCLVIARTKTLHTATNFYLFSLSVSDLLLLVFGLPQEIYELWYRYPYLFGETFCVVRGMCAETSSNASILTIMAFTVERYIAICHPLKSHTMSRPSRAIKLIVLVWLLASFCALPVALQFGIIYAMMDEKGEKIAESASCTVKSPMPHSFEIMSVIFFFLPMTVLTVFYVLIGAQLRQSAEIGCSRPHLQTTASDAKTPHHQSFVSTTASARISERRCSSTSKLSSSRRTVLRILVAVVVAFFVCWAPHHTQRIFSAVVVNNASLQTETAEKIYYIMTYVSGIMYYLSATVNPILYNIMSHRYRSAFRETISCICSSCNCKSDKEDRKNRVCYRNTSRRSLTNGRMFSSPLNSGVFEPGPRSSRRTTYASLSVDHGMIAKIIQDEDRRVGKECSKQGKVNNSVHSLHSSISNSSLQLVEDDDIELKEYVSMLKNFSE